jgi:hypothetical protein
VVDFRGLSRLLLRIAGAVIFTIAIAQIPQQLMWNVVYLREAATPVWAQIGLITGSSLLPIALGAGLMAFPGAITNRLVGGEPVGATMSDAVKKLETTAFAVLGTYLVVQALIDGAYLWGTLQGYWLIADLHPGFRPGLRSDHAGAIVGASVKFILGLAFVFGASGLAALRQRVGGARGNLS